MLLTKGDNIIQAGHPAPGPIEVRESRMRMYLKTAVKIIGHFRVAVKLIMKARLSAKLFI